MNVKGKATQLFSSIESTASYGCSENKSLFATWGPIWSVNP